MALPLPRPCLDTTRSPGTCARFYLDVTRTKELAEGDSRSKGKKVWVYLPNTRAAVADELPAATALYNAAFNLVVSRRVERYDRNGAAAGGGQHFKSAAILFDS